MRPLPDGRHAIALTGDVAAVYDRRWMSFVGKAVNASHPHVSVGTFVRTWSTGESIIMATGKPVGIPSVTIPARLKPKPLFLIALTVCTMLVGCNKPTAKDRPSTPLVDAARSQIGVTLRYDGTYEKLAYPAGDVPRECGVCTDVVIRALRDARQFDLQQAVHEDMKADFAAYPKLWGLKSPDTNIDHRRVPNLQTYFERKGWELPVTSNPDDYQPGDLVTCKVDSGRPHIMVVSNRLNSKGVSLVIHNLGKGAQEENLLFYWKLTGHYRLPTAP